MARKAYISSMRAYSRMKDKKIFNLKKMNLKHIAKGFGLNEVKSTFN